MKGDLPPHDLSKTSPDPAERLREALDLYELGERIYRQRLRREHPDAAEDELERLVTQWLTHP
jgi:hypothetical protein